MGSPNDKRVEIDTVSQNRINSVKKYEIRRKIEKTVPEFRELPLETKFVVFNDST